MMRPILNTCKIAKVFKKYIKNHRDSVPGKVYICCMRTQPTTLIIIIDTRFPDC